MANIKYPQKKSDLIEMLEEDIYRNSRFPTSADLKPERNSGDFEWSLNYTQLRREFEDLNNAIWLTGNEPRQRKLTQHRNEDTELVEHELRTLEHKLGRSPTINEMQFNNPHITQNMVQNRFNELQEIVTDSGIPYPTQVIRGEGAFKPEEQDDIVEKLFREKKHPRNLTEYGDTKIESVIDTYSPWVDFSAERIDNVFEEEELNELMDYKRSDEAFRYIGEGNNHLTDLAEEMGINSSTVEEYTRELEEKGLVENNLGYSLTEKGERIYEQIF